MEANSSKSFGWLEHDSSVETWLIQQVNAAWFIKLEENRYEHLYT